MMKTTERIPQNEEADSESPRSEARTRRTPGGLALLAVAVGALVAIGATLDVELVRSWVAAQGSWAPVAFVMIGMTLAALCVPMDLLAIVAGLLFDFVFGLVLIALASYLGQCLAYFVARWLFRERFARLLASRPRLRIVERAIELRGALLLFLMRLAPIPAGPMSYLVGASRMPFGSFALANLGLIPVSFFSLLIARGLLQAGAEGGPDVWSLVGAGCAIAALFTVGALVRRLLSRVERGASI